MYRKYKITGLIMVMLFAALTSRADYPMGKGRTAIIGTFNYFYSSKYFDANRKLIRYPIGDRFQSNAYNLTIMHGLSRRVDFSASLPFAVQSLKSGGVEQKNSGLGEVNLGLAFHFPSENYKKYFTIKGSLILPLYQNDSTKTPFLGYASKGASVAMNYSFSPFTKGFAIVEVGYTRFFDYNDGPNQYRGTIIVGKMLTEYTSLTLNFSHQISKSINTAFNPNVVLNKNFNGGIVNLSLSQRISRTITPAIQGFYTLYGKNMGLGVGASFFVTVRLP